MSGCLLLGKNYDPRNIFSILIKALAQLDLARVQSIRLHRDRRFHRVARAAQSVASVVGFAAGVPVINGFWGSQRRGAKSTAALESERRAQINKNCGRVRSEMQCSARRFRIACCTLSPETVRITGKCAPGKLSELAAVDATAASLSGGEMRAVCATSTGWQHDSRAEKGSLSRRASPQPSWTSDDSLEKRLPASAWPIRSQATTVGRIV